MIRSSRVRLAALALGVGLLAVLPAGAAAKPKAKTKLTQVTIPFLLSGTPDEADGSAACPSGTTLLSGGALPNTPAPAGPPLLDVEMYKSGPSGNSWAIRYDNDSLVNLLPSAQAICLKDRLKVTGADGKPKAITRVRQVNTPFTLPPSNDPATLGHAELDVACPSGTTIAGGGASFTATAIDTDIRLEESGPQGSGWHVRYKNDTAVAQTAIASALCLKSKLKVKNGPGNDKARSKFEQVDQGVALLPSGSNSGRSRFTVACPENTTIVGGGGKISPALPLATTDIKLEESGAVGNAWQVLFDNDEATAQSATVHALCLKNRLKVK